MNERELIDRAEIHEVIMRYYRGIDRVDYELVRSCFHADATADYGELFVGNVDGFMAYLREHPIGALDAFERTVHFAGNVLIELAADTAHTETYVMAFHEPKSGHAWDGAFVTVWLRYLDRFERRDGAWRIADRAIAIDWRREDRQAGSAPN